MVHGAKETIPIEHYPSGLPITELKVDSDATVAVLQAMVHEYMASEEDGLVRVVIQRWLVEVAVGDRKKLVELDASDVKSTLRSLGIEDYTKVYVEGPLTNTIDGVGRVLEGMQRERLAERQQQQETIQALAHALGSLTAEVQLLREHTTAVQAANDQNFQQLTQQLALLANTQQQVKDDLQQKVQQIKDLSANQSQQADRLTEVSNNQGGVVQHLNQKIKLLIDDQKQHAQHIFALEQAQLESKDGLEQHTQEIKDQSTTHRQLADRLVAHAEKQQVQHENFVEENRREIRSFANDQKKNTQDITALKQELQQSKTISGNLQKQIKDQSEVQSKQSNQLAALSESHEDYDAQLEDVADQLMQFSKRLKELSEQFCRISPFDKTFNEKVSNVYLLDTMSKVKAMNALIALFFAVVRLQGKLVLLLWFGVSHPLGTIRMMKDRIQYLMNIPDDQKLFIGILIIIIFFASKPPLQVGWQGTLVMLAGNIWWLVAARYLDALRLGPVKDMLNRDKLIVVLLASIIYSIVGWQGTLLVVAGNIWWLVVDRYLDGFGYGPIKDMPNRDKLIVVLSTSIILASVGWQGTLVMLAGNIWWLVAARYPDTISKGSVAEMPNRDKLIVVLSACIILAIVGWQGTLVMLAGNIWWFVMDFYLEALRHGSVTEMPNRDKLIVVLSASIILASVGWQGTLVMLAGGMLGLVVARYTDTI